MSNETTRERKRIRGLLEQSNSKYDIGPFRVGPFKFIVNYQHPPIDRRTRIITMCLIVGSMLIGFVAWLLLIAWFGKSHLHIHIVLSGLMQMTMAGLAAATLYIWWRLGGRRREEPLLNELVAMQTNDSTAYRVTIRGRPSELLRFTTIRDGLFEPQIFRTSHRTLGLRLESRTIAAMLLAVFIVGLFVSGAIASYWRWTFLFAAPVLYVVIRGIPDVPTYYRFVPGRMDCLWFSWVLPKKPGSMMVNLQSVRLSIDLTSRQDMIVIGSPIEPVGFNRDNLSEPLEFSMALVQAALSTATPPPLPMDALTG